MHIPIPVPSIFSIAYFKAGVCFVAFLKPIFDQASVTLVGSHVSSFNLDLCPPLIFSSYYFKTLNQLFCRGKKCYCEFL